MSLNKSGGLKIEEVIKQLESIADHTERMLGDPDADEIWGKDIDALEFAITALRSMSESGEYHFRDDTKMVPLSLEQLKQMDGEPVWVVPLKKEDWDSHWDVMKHGCAIAESKTKPRKTYFLYEDSYRIRWLAYSYPPAHIDVKVFCGNWEGEADGYADGELVYDVWRCGNCGHVEETDDPDLLPRFCPRCGRAMTPEAWAELERRLSGENFCKGF